MKLFLRIFTVLTIITFSFSGQSNIDNLFAECEFSSREKNWQDFRSKDEALDKAIKQEPALLQDSYYTKSSLIYIKALLHKGQLRDAYNLIYSVSSGLFPALKRLPQDNHHKVSESMLRAALENPSVHIDEFKQNFAYAAFEVSCALSEYYMMIDELEYAERLAYCLVDFTEKQPAANNPFTITDINLKVSYYKQLGDVWTLMRKYDDALGAYSKAMTLFSTDTISLQKGFLLLRLAHLCALNSDEEHAREMLLSASPHFDGHSRLGEACVKFASAEIDYVFGTITNDSFDNVNAAINTFTSVGDLYKEGLALLLQHKMLKAVDHDDEELAEQLYQNASNLAQKKYLPLLARQVRGQDYSPSIITDDDESSFAGLYSSQASTADPANSQNFDSPSASSSSSLMNNNVVIPATQSEAADPDN